MSREILRINDLSKQYNGQQVLDGINLSIHAGQKIALVGENGAGKSTLARIIAGAEAPDTGSQRLAAGTVVGWLPQEVTADDDVALEAYIAGIVGDLLALEARLRQMECGDRVVLMAPMAWARQPCCALPLVFCSHSVAQ